MFQQVLFTSMILLASTGAVLAQDDEATGGTETPGSYEEKVFMPEVGTAEIDIWSLEDSILRIPAHATYRDWNTQTIFTSSYTRIAIKDTAKLVLAYEPCDHFVPTCGVMTSKYGMRKGRPHNGVDIRVDIGDPIVAAFAGMVRISRYSRSFGHVVVVRHDNGLESLYAHLSKRKVKPGDMVEAGQLLGLGGNTGRSSGAHLHFELRYLGRSIDPADVFNLTEGDLQSSSLNLYRGRIVQERTVHTSDKESAPIQQTAIHQDVYIVKRGDTLYGLGRRHGVSVSQLCRINGISQGSTLRIGQRLRLSGV